MSEIVNDIEHDFIIIICQMEAAFLESINRGISPKIFSKTENQLLYRLIKKFFTAYKKLPTPEELLTFAQTADGIEKEQKEQSVLYYQELLASDRPNVSIDILIDAMFNNFKKEAASQ